MHLGERAVGDDGVRRWVNALRPGGKVHPYVDRAKPEVKEIRYYTPAVPAWGRRIGHVVRLPQAGRRLDKNRLAGSSTFARAPTTLSRSSAGSATCRGSRRRTTPIGSPSPSSASGAARSSTATTRSARIATSGCPAQHYAPGTDQNMPANGCLRTIAVDVHVEHAADAGHDLDAADLLLELLENLRRQTDGVRPRASGDAVLDADQRRAAHARFLTCCSSQSCMRFHASIWCSRSVQPWPSRG